MRGVRAGRPLSPGLIPSTPSSQAVLKVWFLGTPAGLPGYGDVLQTGLNGANVVAGGPNVSPCSSRTEALRPVINPTAPDLRVEPGDASSCSPGAGLGDPHSSPEDAEPPNTWKFLGSGAGPRKRATGVLTSQGCGTRWGEGSGDDWTLALTANGCQALGSAGLCGAAYGAPENTPGHPQGLPRPPHPLEDKHSVSSLKSTGQDCPNSWESRQQRLPPTRSPGQQTFHTRAGGGKGRPGGSQQITCARGPFPRCPVNCSPRSGAPWSATWLRSGKASYSQRGLPGLESTAEPSASTTALPAPWGDARAGPGKGFRDGSLGCAPACGALGDR